MDCDNLESFRFPDHWKAASKQLFENCSKLKDVDFNQVELIDEESFQDCNGLISVHIPSSVKAMMGFAFTGCYHLESITFDEGIETLYGSFNSAIIDQITIPASVKWIGSTLYTNRNDSHTTVIFKGECPSLVEDQDHPIFTLSYGSDGPIILVPLAYLDSYHTQKDIVLGYYSELGTY